MRLKHFFELGALFATQFRSPSRVEAIQRRRLSRLLRHAYEKVPFYRELFDSQKIAPEDIRTVADLRALPFTTKAQLQTVPPREIVSRDVDPDRCRRRFTSGTTGVPLELYFMPDDWTRLNLGFIRAFAACGTRPWHRIVSFVNHKDINKERGWYESLGLWKQRDLSSWQSPDEWIACLRAWRPQTIIGFTITLRLLAEAIVERGITDIRPAVVISGSGLLDQFTRDLLESVFCCRVADFYGSYEGGALAWECRRCGGYHVSAETVVLEVLRDDQPASPGEEGDVVITNLQSFTMPFIRYRQGDVVVRSTHESRCGRGLPLLERVAGRTDDFITLPDGRRLSSFPFYYAIQPAPGIRRWRVVQESRERLRVDLEPRPSFGSSSRELIEGNLRDLLGDGVAIEIVLTESLQIDPAMKFRQVSSRVRPCGP